LKLCSAPELFRIDAGWGIDVVDQDNDLLVLLNSGVVLDLGERLVPFVQGAVSPTDDQHENVCIANAVSATRLQVR